jgi:hypothetical protein
VGGEAPANPHLPKVSVLEPFEEGRQIVVFGPVHVPGRDAMCLCRM